MDTATFTERFKGMNLLSLPASGGEDRPVSFGLESSPRFEVDPDDEMTFVDAPPRVSVNVLSDEDECFIVVRWVRDGIGFALVRESDTYLEMHDLRLMVFTAGSPQSPIITYHEADMAIDPQMREFVLDAIGRESSDELEDEAATGVATSALSEAARTSKAATGKTRKPQDAISETTTPPRPASKPAPGPDAPAS